MTAIEPIIERERRKAVDRETANFLMPGIPSQIDMAGNALREAVESLGSASTHLFRKLSSGPMERLNIAANLLAMPAPFITKLLDEFGPEGVEPLLDEIERSCASIRAIMKNIPRSIP